MHDVPRLVIGQPILFPIIDDLAGHANVLTGRCDVRPHLASVGSEHVEVGRVGHVCAIYREILNLAVEAIVQWVKTLHNVPSPADKICVDRFDSASWSAAGRVVEIRGLR